jgi:tRNA G46 methylase TrmB
LINEAFSEVVRAALAKDGVVYLRTDDADYFAQMTRVFDANKNLAPTPTPDRLAAVLTDFERTFVSRGIQTNRSAYRRVQ